MTDFASARVAMVDSQVRPSDVSNIAIIQAMLAVPREEFVPQALRPVAYLGEHIPLGPGRVVLDPRIFAKLLNALEILPEHRVLVIGCGLGYPAAVLARIAGTVVALEEDPDLAREATARLSGLGPGEIRVEQGPLAHGAPRQGPYDAILVEGAVETLPAGISDQLASGGRIAAIHVDGAAGQARLGLRTPQGIAWRRIFDATAPVLPGFARSKAFEF